MVLKRLREALEWRWFVWKRTRYLRKTFKNGEELVRSYLARTPCGRALCRDGTVILHPSDRTGLVQMILEVWYDEVYTRDFYTPMAGDIIVDAGANIGLFALLMARNHPECKVIAFEPFEENHRLLMENLTSAKTSTVRVFQTALAAEAGVGMMADGGERAQDHRLTFPANAPVGQTSVRTCSFSDMLSLVGDAPIGLLKCDIEGSEYDFIGRADPADLRKVRRYAIEYHDNARPGTLALLQEKLGATHDMVVRAPDGCLGYGMLYATAKDSR